MQAELDALQNRPDLAVYEKDFIAAAKEYSEQTILRSAFRSQPCALPFPQLLRP